YGQPRATVEAEIFKRLGAADQEKRDKLEALKQAQQARMAAMGQPAGGGKAQAPGSSFLDEWIAKRGATKPQATASTASSPMVPTTQNQPSNSTKNEPPKGR